jgi:putative transcriptional regulator
MGEHEPTRVMCNLDEMLRRRAITLTRLSALTNISIVNLSVLKNDRARAVRFSTLVALCDALDCQPGDLFIVAPEATQAS